MDNRDTQMAELLQKLGKKSEEVDGIMARYHGARRALAGRRQQAARTNLAA